MRSFLFIIVVSLPAAWVVPAAGQTFTAAMADSELTAPLAGEGVFEGTMTNASQQPVTLALIRTLNALPAGWSSSLCFQACYPGTVDTIMTTSEFGSSPLQPAETRDFSVHVFPLDLHGTAVIRVLVQNTRQPTDSFGFTLRLSSVQSSAGGADGTPGDGFGLIGAYPNPFNSTALVEFRLVRRERIRLAVYDLVGREVALLADEEMSPGLHTRRFSAEGRSSGVYVVRLSAGGERAVRRMVLLR